MHTEQRAFVLNKSYGGFGLSHKAIDLLLRKGYIPTLETLEKIKKYDQRDYWIAQEIRRDDPLLVEVVNELGDDANGECCDLSVVMVNIEYNITNRDGYENIEIYAHEAF